MSIRLTMIDSVNERFDQISESRKESPLTIRQVFDVTI